MSVPSMRHRAALLSLPLLLSAPAACADAQGEPGTSFPAEDVRRAAALPLVEVAWSTEDTLFQQPTGVDVDGRGRIFVSDWYGARVLVLGTDGGLLRVIGRRGLGPGEFRAIRGVQVLEGDSVLVYDPLAARLSVFAPDAEHPAYVRNLFDLSGGPPFWIWRTPGSPGYVALTRPPFRQHETEPRLDEVRMLDPEGRPAGEPLRRYPSRSFIRVQQGGGFSVMPNPFGHEGFVAVGREHVYLGWSDTLGAAVLDGAGRETSSFRIPYHPPAITRADVDAARADLPEQAAATFGRAIGDSAPARWPPLRGMLSDVGGRVWLGLPASAGEPREWAAFDADGGYHASVFVPATIEVHAIRGGRVYGFARDELDRLSLVVLEIGARRGRGDR
jgi:hypothetical protein